MANILGDLTIDISKLVTVDENVCNSEWVTKKCEDNDLNNVARIYQVSVDTNKKPSDLKEAFIEITGKIWRADNTPLTAADIKASNAAAVVDAAAAVTATNNATALPHTNAGETTIRDDALAAALVLTNNAAAALKTGFIFKSGWIYSLFDRISMQINGVETERIDNFAATMRMKHMIAGDRSATDLEHACLWTNDETAVLAASGNPLLGIYNEKFMTHSVKADGSWCFLLPLRYLFTTINTFGTMYSRMAPTFCLQRSDPKTIGTPYSLRGGIGSPLVGASLSNHIDSIKLMYETKTFTKGIVEQAVDNQYLNGTISVHHRAVTCSILPYNSNSVTTRLPLNSSPHGNHALILAWVDTAVPSVRGVADETYKFLPITVSELEVNYGPHTVYHVQGMTDRHFTQGGTAYTPMNFQRMYADYVLNAGSVFGIPRDEVPSYSEWMNTKPFIIINMEEHILSSGEVVADMLNVRIKHIEAVRERKLMCWLYSNNAFFFEPLTNSIVNQGTL